MPSEQQHFDAARKFQAFYDETLRKIGARAPQPILGETVNHYRRETLRNLKRTFLPQNHDLYQVQFRQLPADVLQVFEPQLLQACVDWIGRESFVKQMGRPGRRVKSFLFDRSALRP